MDEFHEDAEDIYMIGNVIERNGVSTTWGDSPLPLADAIRSDCPQVKYATAIIGRNITAIRGTDVFNEHVYIVDDDFLDIFSFPLIKGNRADFWNPSSIYLTEKKAKKYFGNENPIGQEIGIKVGDEEKQVKIVRGVFKDHSIDSSIKFQFLMPNFAEAKIVEGQRNDWKHWIKATFIKMYPGESPEQLTPILEKHLNLQRAQSPDWPVARLRYISLLGLTRSFQDLRSSMIDGNELSSVISLIVVAVVLLLLACFNYANNMIVILSKRFREIGIRKVIGGRRRDIIFQFLGENLMFVFLAMVFGAILTRFFFLPGMLYLFDDGWEISYFQLNYRTIIYFVCILLITALGAGFYPSLIVSKFVPVDIIKGKMRMPGQNVFIKTMIAVQFSLTLLALIIPVSLYMNARYQMQLDWGYEKDGVYVVPVKNGKNFELLKNKISDNPNIQNIAGTHGHIGKYCPLDAIEVNHTKHEVNAFGVGENYLEITGLRLLEGRNFGPDALVSNELIVNRCLLDELNWETGIGKTVKIDTSNFYIVGVIENFHLDDFDKKIPPVYIRVAKEERYQYMLVKIDNGHLVQTAEQIEKAFRELFPELQFNGFFQDEVFADFFRNNKSIVSFFTVTGMIALLIAIMGLFGLVSATLAKKEKEIGIRKILGATVSNIVNIITRPILIVLAIGSLLAIAPAWLFLNMFLKDNYAYHIEINHVPFVIGFGLLLVVSLATMLLQTLKSANANPVKTLRNE